MRKNRQILFLIVATLLYSGLFTEVKAEKELAWSTKASQRTGLYTTQNFFVTHGVSLSFDLMYYFGDVDNVGVAFNGGFNKNNLSYGGALSFQYIMPMANCCNLRFSLGAGKLNGNNAMLISKNIDKHTGKPRDDYRKFGSWFLQPAVGVEVYPFTKAGFYIYGGIAFAASHIQFEKGTIIFDQDNKTIDELVPNLRDTTWSFLPMAQLGIGYSIRLTHSWSLNIEAMGQLGVCDIPRMNLDAWPLPGTAKDGYVNNKFPDGWFQVGLTVTYRWRTCERCRHNDLKKGVRSPRRKPGKARLL